jgi:methionine synthase II (cobalamin-independent)
MATPALPQDTIPASFLHLNPPFRAEHVGSLLRPPALLEQRTQFQENSCTAKELEEAENAAIAAAVKLQQSVGIRSITDGEMRR